MKKAISFIFIISQFFLFSHIAKAADTYHFDKNHTSIIWLASHQGFSKSTGQFVDFDGQVMLDEENPANSSVEVTIQIESLFTGIEKFTKHLLSKDFFIASEFKTAKFVSNKVEITGDKQAKVHGDLTMLGISKPLTLDVVLNRIDYDKDRTAGFSVTGQIKRSEYGMTFAIPNIPDEVDLLIEAEIIRKE